MEIAFQILFAFYHSAQLHTSRTDNQNTNSSHTVLLLYFTAIRNWNFICTYIYYSFCISNTFRPTRTASEDGTGCSETLTYKIHKPGNYPEENIQYLLFNTTCFGLPGQLQLKHNLFKILGRLLAT